LLVSGYQQVIIILLLLIIISVEQNVKFSYSSLG